MQKWAFLWTQLFRAVRSIAFVLWLFPPFWLLWYFFAETHGDD